MWLGSPGVVGRTAPRRIGRGRLAVGEDAIRSRRDIAKLARDCFILEAVRFHVGLHYVLCRIAAGRPGR